MEEKVMLNILRKKETGLFDFFSVESSSHGAFGDLI